MKRVLVLGAGGVLGSEITRQLEQQPNVQQTCYDIRRFLTSGATAKIFVRMSAMRMRSGKL